MQRTPCHAASCHAARAPVMLRPPPVMLRAVAASRKSQQNGLSPEWLDSATDARNDEVEGPTPCNVRPDVMLRAPRHAAPTPVMLRPPPLCCAHPRHAGRPPRHAARSRSIQKTTAERFKPGIE